MVLHRQRARHSAASLDLIEPTERAGRAGGSPKIHLCLLVRFKLGHERQIFATPVHIEPGGGRRPRAGPPPTRDVAPGRARRPATACTRGEWALPLDPLARPEMDRAVKRALDYLQNAIRWIWPALLAPGCQVLDSRIKIVHRTGLLFFSFAIFLFEFSAENPLGGWLPGRISGALDSPLVSLTFHIPGRSEIQWGIVTPSPPRGDLPIAAAGLG